MRDQGDWTKTGYARVYATLADDHPVVWDDDALLAWYVRLLVNANGSWPAAASFPAGVPDPVTAALTAAGVVEVRNGGRRYAIHGLDRLREPGNRGRPGGYIRAANAGRDAGGRFVPAGNVATLVPDAGPDAGHSNGNAGPDAGEPRWDATLDDQRSSDYRTDTEDVKPASRLVSRPVAGGRNRARTARVPDRVPEPTETVKCSDYRAHQTQHVRVPGIGWKCLACETTQRDDAPTLKQRVGWSPPAAPLAVGPPSFDDDDGSTDDINDRPF